VGAQEGDVSSTVPIADISSWGDVRIYDPNIDPGPYKIDGPAQDLSNRTRWLKNNLPSSFQTAFGGVADANYYNATNGDWYQDAALTIPSTDNGPALRAALLTLGAAGGGLLRIPAGSYAFRTTEGTNADARVATPTSGVAIAGDGAGNTFLRLGPTMGVTHFFGTPQFSPPTITAAAWYDLTIDGNGNFNTNPLVQLPGDVSPTVHRNALLFIGYGSDITVKRCAFINANSLQTVLIGDEVGTSIVMSRVRIKDCLFYNMANSTSLTDHSSCCSVANDVRISNVSCVNPVSNTHCMEIGACFESVGSNYIISDCTGQNYQKANNYSTDSVLLRNFKFVRGSFRDLTRGVDLWPFHTQQLANVRIAGTSIGCRPNVSAIQESGVGTVPYITAPPGAQYGLVNLMVCGNSFYMQIPGVSFPRGIDLNVNVDGAILRKNAIRGFSHMGIDLRPIAFAANASPGNLVQDFLVSNNSIIDCGTNGQSGIYAEPAPGELGTIFKRGRLNRNKIVDSQGAPTILAGVYVLGNSSDVEAIDNYIVGPPHFPVVIGAATSTNSHIRPIIGTVALTPGSISAGRTVVLSAVATVYPAFSVDSDITVVPPSASPGIVYSAYLVGAQTVEIRASNITAGALTPPTGTYRITLEQWS
jgi:hypothetical protein